MCWREDWEVVSLPAVVEADEWHRVETVFGTTVRPQSG
jgi:hypothetical protein